MTTYVFYSTDGAINNFFNSNTTVTRQQCDEFAVSRAGGVSTALQMQGPSHSTPFFQLCFPALTQNGNKGVTKKKNGFSVSTASVATASHATGTIAGQPHVVEVDLVLHGKYKISEMAFKSLEREQLTVHEEQEQEPQLPPQQLQVQGVISMEL
ncbi:hypothetical protein N7474_008586 [Penicillium riverlandense]|uniref:uncharacterized protein n=1 Tax=Penicillium riverlandense TaxID=1903569 RepID=UPI0025477AD2|nr:uncharacterized protein N7474_008586 [Penicillium riverlandense]KAJ5812285.1 hypothetical protein N7474_008586 [Penicillium riverlandense]